MVPMLAQDNFKFVSETTQRSNYYFHKSTTNNIFISSTDGLNIYDGLTTKVYRPSTHHMYGLNIQGKFFDDTSGKVWFTTYEAINSYDPKKDDLEYFFVLSAKGDTLKENYRAFHLERNDLYLKAGTEVFIFDIVQKRIKERYIIDLKDYFELAITTYQGKTILFAGDSPGYAVYELQPNGKFSLLDDGKDTISTVMTYSPQVLWFGTNTGKIGMYDIASSEIVSQYKLAPTVISGIARLSDSKLLVAATSNELMEFDLNTRTITNRIYPVSASTGEPLHRLIIPYVDQDTTIWIGSDGQGVFFYSPNKIKFKHWLKSEPNEVAISVTKILEYGPAIYIVLSRGSGIFLIRNDGSVLKHWNSLPGEISGFTAFTGCMVDSDHLLFSSNSVLYSLDFTNGKILPQSYTIGKNWIFRQIDQLPNGKIIASCERGLLQEIIWKDNTISFNPYGQFDDQSQIILYFKIDKSGNIYVSNDEVTLLVLSPTHDSTSHQFSYSLPISGGIRGLADDRTNNAVYISNTQGLFYLDLATKKYNQIIDSDKLLLQTIYSVIADESGNLWLGTNKGLMKYYPADNTVKVFSEMDGIQGQEYNTNAYLKTVDGHMFFGGVNGLNYFHPNDVRLSQKEAPVYINELLINDELDSTYSVPQYVQSLSLGYVRNTVSFEFHAIDYSDPESTRVKYKLNGVDVDYVESKSAQGFARYANLRPGNYTFSIIGANSDGLWNETPKEINIIIHPPFWLTWWFITLISLTIGTLFYWAIRSYYQRKLQKKNQLLREQALIIEKQQAVEHERTRIASEMHDDLGAGLTTIRYLSDKALTQAKDPEEVRQIQKIADHSNALVRNMSEIIWAMNSRFDNAENLIGYLRRYASEYLEEHHLPLKFVIEDDHLQEISIGGEKRRNLFLVFKEVLHNTVKYSKAERVEISVKTGNEICISISEFGAVGFDPAISSEKGNGIYNCNKRMSGIQGHITFEKSNESMNIIISAPINS
jgi:signal transduction histidine kinase/ligand-binding sensor domain-containing protein